jgi:hypothetical protein
MVSVACKIMGGVVRSDVVVVEPTMTEGSVQGRNVGVFFYCWFVSFRLLLACLLSKRAELVTMIGTGIQVRL